MRTGDDEVADDELPDPMEPGTTAPHTAAPDATTFPRGDVRVATWIALISAVIVVAWYLSLILLGGLMLDDTVVGVLQIGMWALAVVSFVCGLICLNARRYREFAASGFIAGVVALLVTLTLGLSAGLQLMV